MRNTGWRTLDFKLTHYPRFTGEAYGLDRYWRFGETQAAEVAGLDEQRKKGKQGRRILPDVLEKCAGQHRQTELDVENDEEHAEKAAPDAHL